MFSLRFITASLFWRNFIQDIRSAVIDCVTLHCAVHTMLVPYIVLKLMFVLSMVFQSVRSPFLQLHRLLVVKVEF